MRTEGIAASSFRKGEKTQIHQTRVISGLKTLLADNKPETRGPGEQLPGNDKLIRHPFGRRNTRLLFIYFLFFKVSKCCRVFFEKTFLHECRVLLILFC